MKRKVVVVTIVIGLIVIVLIVGTRLESRENSRDKLVEDSNEFVNTVEESDEVLSSSQEENEYDGTDDADSESDDTYISDYEEDNATHGGEAVDFEFEEDTYNKYKELYDSLLNEEQEQSEE